MKGLEDRYKIVIAIELSMAVLWVVLFIQGALWGMLIIFAVLIIGMTAVLIGEKRKMKRYLAGLELVIIEREWDCIPNNLKGDKIVKTIQKEFEAIERERKNQVYSEMGDRQTKVSLLQSQINPHFLYNSLETVRGQAYMDGNEEIADMVAALGSYFRYSIDQKEYLVSLRRELNNIQNYFLIQKYRYDDRICLKVEVMDPDTLECFLPKLMLQPLVENAVFHGLEKKKDGGTVTIRVERTDKRVLIYVSDDGVGMNKDTLEKVRDSIYNEEDVECRFTGSGNGIALKNISKRMKLVFGSHYGIHIYSNEGKGTDIEISLPITFDDRNVIEDM